MTSESQLREQLRKIETLFVGAGTARERVATEAALRRSFTPENSIPSEKTLRSLHHLTS
jgi:hypothetical protein